MKFKKYATIGLLSLMSLGLNGDSNIRVSSMQKVKDERTKNSFYVSKVTDSKEKISAYMVIDSNKNIIGDEPREKYDYQDISRKVYLEKIMNEDRIREMQDTIDTIEKVRSWYNISNTAKGYCERVPKMVGSLLENIAIGGADLDPEEQKEIIKNAGINLGDEVLTELYNGLDQEIQNLQNAEDLEKYLKERLKKSITLQLSIADNDLKISQSLARKSNRTYEEDRELWKRFTEGNAKTVAYMNLASELVSENTIKNISYKIFGSLSKDFTGEDLLSSLSKDVDFNTAFAKVQKDLEKIMGEYHQIGEQWNIHNGSDAAILNNRLKNENYKNQVFAVAGISNRKSENKKQEQPKKIAENLPKQNSSKTSNEITAGKLFRRIKEKNPNITFKSSLNGVREIPIVEISLKAETIEPTIEHPIKCPDVDYTLSINYDIYRGDVRVFGSAMNSTKFNIRYLDNFSNRSDRWDLNIEGPLKKMYTSKDVTELIKGLDMDCKNTYNVEEAYKYYLKLNSYITGEKNEIENGNGYNIANIMAKFCLENIAELEKIKNEN